MKNLVFRSRNPVIQVKEFEILGFSRIEFEILGFSRIEFEILGFSIENLIFN